MWGIDRLVALGMGIGVLGAFGVVYRLYKMEKANYASKVEIFQQQKELAESSSNSQIDALKELHSVELEKKDLEVRKMQDAFERVDRLLGELVVDFNVAIKFYLAYDLKDISNVEKNMLNKYIGELEDIVASGRATIAALSVLVQIHLKFQREDKAIYYQCLIVEAEPDEHKHLLTLAHV